MEHHIDAVVPVRPVATINQRAGDLERSTACDELASHFAAGRLTGDELNQRLELAMTAQTNRELRLLLADLPVASSAATPPPARPGPAGRRSGLWSAFDGVVLVVLLGSVMVIGVMMLGLAASGQVAMLLLAALGGSLAALAGACLVQLLHRGRRGPTGPS